MRLADSLGEPVRLGTRVARLVVEDTRWRAELRSAAGDEVVSARRVIVATPAPAASELLSLVAPEAAGSLAGIAYAPVVALGLGVDPAQVREPIEGFGFIVPRSAARKLLGCLFMSRIFAGRAPPGRELLHCMLGGARWPEVYDRSDEEIVARAVEDVDAALGLRAEPRTVTLTRWQQAIPQPGTDHVRRIAEIERRVRDLPGLTLAGSYLAGVSVADTLATGVRAAASGS
jgi:oxygen-dependent protoporphyrinogen oxidase